MKNLYDLISSLNKYEFDLVCFFFSSKLSKFNTQKSKILKFFRGLEFYNERDILDFFIKNKLKSDSLFVNKIQEDVLNIIMLQESSKKFRSKYFIDSFEVKRGIVLSELLYRRGLIPLGDEIIKRSVRLGIENEMYGEILILLDMQRVSHGILKGAKVVDGYRKQVDFYKNLFFDSLDTVSISNDVVLKGFDGDFDDPVRKKEIEDYLDLLGEIFSRTKSNRIGYWYLRAAVGYYLNVSDFKLALKFSKLLLNLIENGRNLNNPVNVAGANNELAKVFILNKQFSDSIPLIHKSLSLFNHKLNNYLSTLGTLFLANFHLEKFDLCMEIYDQAIVHPKFKEKKDNVIIWNYYKTCLYFKKGLYKEALNSLNQDANALALNKGELFVFSRILFLYLLFETNKSILWSYELASFRKTFPNIKNYKIDRLRIIFSILNKLDRKDFDFPYIEAYEAERFEKLQVVPNIWKPLGYELISFEAWFQEKNAAYNKTSKLRRKK
jgi:hypothetical protein